MGLAVTSPLQGMIARAINNGMRGLFYDAVLTRTTPSVDPSQPWVQLDSTTTEYTCKAIVEQYSNYQIANGLVDVDDRKILILVNSLDVEPVISTDTITILGMIYQLISPVKTDPARAVWEIRGNGQPVVVIPAFDFSDSYNSQYVPLI